MTDSDSNSELTLDRFRFLKTMILAGILKLVFLINVKQYLENILGILEGILYSRFRILVPN